MTEILRAGALKMLVQMIQQEVEDWTMRFAAGGATATGLKRGCGACVRVDAVPG
jgi:hypothetical protein